jgi:DNA-binding response OmpR family regulator
MPKMNRNKEAGADFVPKDTSPDELIATLTPLLRKRNVA